MRQSRGSVIAAIAVFFIATVFQFAALPPADAHGGGFVTPGGHHIKTPPPVTPVPVDNVKDFGAVGNGVIDDTNAIQNAANDAHNRGIGVFFPAGTYLHANSITFNGVAVTGSGNASQLVSNNPANCAVFLTGSGPSIQNMVISTQGLAGASDPDDPQLSTLAVVNATSWTVAHNTFVQGTNTWGLFALQSTVGAVTANVFNGTGNSNDVAIVANIATNITASNNLTQNEAIGFTSNGSLFIAVLSNTFGNVSWPTLQSGVYLVSTINCTVAQNTIQMVNSNPGTLALVTFFCDNTFVQSNDTWGGFDGIEVYSAGSGSNVVTQNTIHNCGIQGITAANVGNSAVQITSNTFGECGLIASGPDPFFLNAVILVEGLAPPSSDASGATTFVQNNSYQGHANGLSTYVTSTFTSPPIPAANVAGNTQTQTSLGNHI